MLTFVRRCSVAIALLFALIHPAPAVAKAAGEVGAISRSTISIRASVAPRMRLTGADVVRVPDAFAGGRQPLVVPMCVATNTSTRLYRVTALGPSAAGTFQTIDSDGRLIPATVTWKAGGDHQSVRRLVPGSASPNFEASVGSCGAGDRSMAILSIEPASKVADSSETSLPERTLTLLIAPE